MAQKRKTDQSKLIAAAALSLADKGGWDKLTIESVARKAKMSPTAAREQFADTWEILSYILEALDKKTAAAAKKNLSGKPREDLFEILMSRLEIMEEHRGAY